MTLISRLKSGELYIGFLSFMKSPSRFRARNHLPVVLGSRFQNLPAWLS
jgi:hypothetical protein